MAKVLVVEDSADARQLLRDVLEKLGHTVVEVTDGLECVKSALTNRPDLIVLDLMIPAASGDSALVFMRGTPELADIPILVVSAHPDVARIARVNGANDWVAKPISIDELTRKIKAILSAPSRPAQP
jgi:CheY-like chemotaxis protein